MEIYDSYKINGVEHYLNKKKGKKRDFYKGCYCARCSPKYFYANTSKVVRVRRTKDLYKADNKIYINDVLTNIEEYI